MNAPHRDALRVLDSWRHTDPEQIALREAYRAFLVTHVDATNRSCALGHLTASALVVNPERDAVLLTLHPKVGRWLQLGGHIEDDDQSLEAAALREVQEESGYRPVSISGAPVRLDRHPVPCGGRWSEHLDVQYVVVVNDDRGPVQSAESLDLTWFPMTRLPTDLDTSVRSLVDQAIAGDDVQVTIG